MLKSAKITNFCSIGATQEISFEINPKDILDSSACILEDGNSINLVSCLIGSNAAGKTTILKALSFLFWFVQKSYTTAKEDEKIAFEQHRLHEGEATVIEIEFISNKITYQYLLELNPEQVIRERLRRKNVRYSKVFELTRTEGSTSISSIITLNKVDEQRFKNRKNVSLLSSLIDTGYLEGLDFLKKIKTNVNYHGAIIGDPLGVFNVSKKLFEDLNLQKQVLSYLEDIDLSISDFQFKEISMADKDSLKEGHVIQLLECIHKTEKGDFSLALFEESNGTQQSFSMFINVLPMLNSGGLVIIDEVEAGLHPEVAKKLISLFANPEINVNQAQLLFSTHQHILLNDRTKSQIFLCEKESLISETEVYRLDDVEGVRNDENYFNKYIAGAYGATPNISWL